MAFSAISWTAIIYASPIVGTAKSCTANIDFACYVHRPIAHHRKNPAPGPIPACQWRHRPTHRAIRVLRYALDLGVVVAAAGVVAAQWVLQLIRRRASAEVRNGPVQFPAAGVGALGLVNEHHIAGVDAPDRVYIGNVDGVRARAPAVDDADAHAVVVVQVAAGGHHAVSPISEHIIRRRARTEWRGVLTHAPQRAVVLAVDLDRVQGLGVRA